MIDWKQQKRDCDRAAVEDAEGGEDRLSFYTTKGLGERYQKVRKERLAEITATQEREEILEPLRSISRDADILVSTTSSNEVAELARIVERLADYLLAKEEGR